MSKLRDSDAKKRAASNLSADYSEALARGIHIIKAFTPDARQMTLSEVARVVDLPRATVRRALYTMAQLGYVETEGRIFRLAPKILELSAAYLGSNPITHILQPACERIAQEFGVACSVGVLDGKDAIMIARGAPMSSAASGLGLGYRLPAWCSALGRVLLASIPSNLLNDILDEIEPQPITPFTVTDKASIRKAITDVKEHGFALVDREAELGIRSLSVPVTRFDGKVIAAMNVGAQVDAVSLEKMVSDFLPRLKDEAKAAGNLIQ